MDAAHDSGTASGVASAKIAEALEKGSQAVFNRHAPDPQAALEAVAGTGIPTGQAVPVDPVVAQANRQAVSRFVVTLIAAVDRRVEKALYLQAKPLGEDYARAVSAEASMDSTEREELGELAAVLAEKYGMNFRYATEVAASMAVGGWVFGIGLAFKKTAQMRKAKEEAPNN